MHTLQHSKFVIQNDEEAYQYTLYTVGIVTNGDIGEEQEEIEFAPIEEPAAPAVPATPAPVPAGAPA